MVSVIHSHLANRFIWITAEEPVQTERFAQWFARSRCVRESRFSPRAELWRYSGVWSMLRSVPVNAREECGMNAHLAAAGEWDPLLLFGSIDWSADFAMHFFFCVEMAAPETHNLLLYCFHLMRNTRGGVLSVPAHITFLRCFYACCYVVPSKSRTLYPKLINQVQNHACMLCDVKWGFQTYNVL